MPTKMSMANRARPVIGSLYPPTRFNRDEDGEPASGFALFGENCYFDQRAVLNHNVDVVPLPVPGNALQDLTAMLRIGNLPSGCRKIGTHPLLEMKREIWIGIEIGQPATTLVPRLAADVEMTADVMEHDFDATRLACLTAIGRDVNGLHRTG